MCFSIVFDIHKCDMHFCIRLYLTFFRVNGYTRSLMDVKHSYALKSESKSESGPLVENSSQIGVVKSWFGVLMRVDLHTYGWALASPTPTPSPEFAPTRNAVLPPILLCLLTLSEFFHSIQHKRHLNRCRKRSVGTFKCVFIRGVSPQKKMRAGASDGKRDI